MYLSISGLRAALRRKALAMDLSGVLSYKVAELWRTSFFTRLQREAHKAVTVNQIMEADKRLWVLLSERTRGNVASKLGSPPPCDAEFTKLADSQEFFFLAPLPLSPPVPDFVRPRFEPYPDPEGNGKGKRKGKKPNKGANAATFDLPKGAKTKTEDEKPLRFCIQPWEMLALQEDQAR